MCSERMRHVCLLLLGVLAACSIREDRSECPCILVADFTALDAGTLSGAGYTQFRWSVRSASVAVSETIPLDGALPDEGVVSVPRGETAYLLVTAGEEDLTGPDGCWRIPEGEPCPPLLSFGAAVDGSMEEVCVPVRLHKAYAVLDVLLRDVLEDGSTYVLTGGVCGYGPDAEPLPGPFRVPLDPGTDGRCRILVPRQLDGSLRLAVYRFGEMERVFSLGEYILDSGYDWSAPDLEDIPLEIDFVHGAVRFKIDQWSKTLYFSIVV